MFRNKRLIYFVIFMGALAALVISLAKMPANEAPSATAQTLSTANVLVLDREQILADSEDRISEAFAIPESLKPRVAFWFDIYTQHGFNHRVIHHIDYPWFVLEVVDVTEILKAPTRALWLNHDRAEKFSKKRLVHFQQLFKSIALKLKNKKTLNQEERYWLAKLKELPGSFDKNLAQASKRLRIQTGQKDAFTDGLKRSISYLEYMETIFESHKLPKELARLPLVESSFNLEAGSKVGALGIWQLMPQVSKKFIMVNSMVDERRSPYKATYVAAWLFKENYKILKGEWPLIVTAYNHGPGGLKKAAKKLGTTDFATIIEKHRSNSFGFASENFYCSFLAALTAQYYAAEIFGAEFGGEFAHVDYVTLPRKIKIHQLAGLSRMTQAEFLRFNPDLRRAYRKNMALPKGFVIFLPKEQVSLVRKGLAKSIKVAQR